LIKKESFGWIFHGSRRKGPDGYEYSGQEGRNNIKRDIVLTEIDIENLIRTKAAICGV